VSFGRPGFLFSLRAGFGENGLSRRFVLLGRIIRTWTLDFQTHGFNLLFLFIGSVNRYSCEYLNVNL
jgi:hypothetical protein